MKILMLCDKMDIGGAETHILTLISELVKRDFDITLISGGGVYIKNILLLGVKYRYAPLDRRDIASVIASRRIVGEEMKRCSIVHAHTRFTAFIANSVRRGTYPPIAVTAHLDFPTFPFGTLTYWGDATLAVSEDIREHLIQAYRVPREQIFMTRNSIDIDAFSGGGNRRKLIIHTSRIDEGRALAAFSLTDIAPKLLSDHPEYRMLIIGDGNRFADLKAAVNRANNELGFEGIILTGARSDIPRLLMHGNIFVGVSRAALEGMAAGLATVIFGGEGYGGIIDENNFDMLAHSNFCARGCGGFDKDRLLADISRLIDSGERRVALAEFYGASLRERYSCALMADDACRVYEALTRAPRVCLMGYFGYSNLGDEVTLNTAIEALISQGVRNISVITASGEREFGEKIKYYNRNSPSAIAKAVSECDIFIMCGGNLFQNETSERSLIYYTQLVNYVRSRGKTVYMLSSGFGDVRGGFSRMLLSSGIGTCTFCGCRTGYDLSVARKNGAKNAVLMPDLCFLLNEGKRRGGEKFFAYIPSAAMHISPSELIMLGRARGLIPIVIILFSKDDERARREFTDSGITCYFPNNYEKIKDILSTCAFTVCERLHGAIFSILCHTPAYINISSTKNRALLAEITDNYRGRGILTPYSANAVKEKKEIGARDSDFVNVIKIFKQRVMDGLSSAF
ncbi:MAG: glycosyltransferase [Clostridia bacterium]|nr:glycosyltransferase [Clostridia bacterium]